MDAERHPWLASSLLFAAGRWLMDPRPLLRPRPVAVDADAPAAGVLGDSGMLRRCERVMDATVAAWRRSRVAVRMATELAAVDGAACRVQLVGCAALAACTARLALVGVERVLGPAWVGLPWLGAMPVALLCAVKPDLVVAAWSGAALRARRRRG